MDDTFWHSMGADGESGFAAEACRALIEHTRDIVLLVGGDGRVVLANAAAEVAYGRPRKELSGMSVADLRPEHARAEIGAQMRAAAEGGILFETVHRNRGGVEFPVEVSSRGVVLGGSPFLISVVRDISARKRREAEREGLVSDLETANRQLEGLLRIVSSTVGRVDLGPLITEVLEALRDVMEAEAALFFVLRGDRWVLEAQSGYPEPDLVGFTMPSDSGFASRVADAGEPLWVQDVTASDAHIPAHDRYAVRAMLGIPIFIDGELFGVLECTWSVERLVSEAERVMLQVAADRVTSAITGAQRFEQASRSRALEAALADSAARLASSHDMGEAIPGALGIMADAMGCGYAAFGEYSGDRFEVLYGHGIDPCSVRIPDHPHREVDADVPLPVVRIEHDSRSALWLKSTLGLTEAVVVPVKIRGEWFGALVFGRDGAAAGFDQRVDDYARRLSAVLSLAYANARDFDAEHRIAETLQEALLRLDGQVTGVTFDHQYRSSTLAARVGGDFYDVFAMEGGRVGVLVGDVSGKGLDAAVLTTLVKHTIRAFAHETASPALIMSRANSVLAGPAQIREFASVLLVVIEPESGRCTYCRAGHPPALVVRADGAVEFSECGSPVIGAFQNLDYEECHFVLGRGDLLVLYTDGVTEARDESGGFFGDERLADFVKGIAGADPAAATRAIDAKVRQFTAGRLSDDVAILVAALS